MLHYEAGVFYTRDKAKANELGFWEFEYSWQRGTHSGTSRIYCHNHSDLLHLVNNWNRHSSYKYVA